MMSAANYVFKSLLKKCLTAVVLWINATRLDVVKGEEPKQ